jgi:CPA2 family monovalent cation:H+ antiporter-2
MAIMFILGTIAGLLLGWTFTEALFLGTMLMMSSTIIIIKILHETDQMDTLHGRLLVGKLIVQDIAAIVVITTLTSLTSADTSIWRFLPLMMGIVFMILMIVLGRKIFPRLIESVNRAPSKELFLLTIFGICISIAVISESLDLSLALGAFMAGIILSESDLHLDIMEKVTPLKDIFLVIFFVSIGMTIDPVYLIRNPLPVLVVVIILMAGKALANSVSLKMLGYHPKTSMLVGLGLMQIGEFSFIIASLGIKAELLSEGVYSTIVATALITMVLTPYAMRSSPNLYNRLLARGIIKPKTHDEAYMDHRHKTDIKARGLDGKHVVVLGYAEVAQEALSCLDLVKQPYTVVDYDPVKVGRMRAMGIDCIQGDAANEKVLARAGIANADLIIMAISDTLDAEMALNHCQVLNPDTYIIARAYGNYDRDRIGTFAQDVIISEEVAGKRMAWHVLRNLGLKDEAIKRDIEIVDHKKMSVETEEICQ